MKRELTKQEKWFMDTVWCIIMFIALVAAVWVTI